MWAKSSAEALDEEHEVPRRAYWARKHARAPVTKARMRSGVENFLPFEGQHAEVNLGVEGVG